MRPDEASIQQYRVGLGTTRLTLPRCADVLSAVVDGQNIRLFVMGVVGETELEDWTIRVVPTDEPIPLTGSQRDCFVGTVVVSSFTGPMFYHVFAYRLLKVFWTRTAT